MDDEFQQLEAELKRLRPAAASPELMQRLERQLAVSGQRRGARFSWIWFAGLPAAAAIVALVLSHSSRERAQRLAPEPAPIVAQTMEPSLKPVAAENLLISSRDEGLITLEDGTPARRQRLEF